MKVRPSIFTLRIIAIFLLLYGCRNSRKAETETESAGAATGFQRVVQDLPEGVEARVDGIEISEEQVAKEMEPMMTQLNRDYVDRDKDGEYLHSRRVIRGRAIESLITMALIGREMKKNNITITQEQIDRHIEESAKANAMTVEQLEALVTSRNQQSFEEWKELMQYDKRLGIMKLVEMQYGKGLDVAESDARKFYQDYHHVFKKPARIRASHILIKSVISAPEPHPSRTDTEAKAKAEELLKQIKNGADFAELATKYSEDASAENGGDLGFATRRGWVPQFSQVAFALKTGEVSDVVKTPYGYHIIKVTDRQEPGVVSFEEAKGKIIERMKTSKMGRLRVKYIESIRSKAKIEYAPGNLITLIPLIES